MTLKFNRVVGAVLVLGLGLVPTLAQTAPLTVVLRDSYGQPLSGVLCEVLSYDWGLQLGQPYAVIAQGETDKTGQVVFDSSLWPHSGYRFRFTPTPHMQPNDTFFESRNQYRGYPAALVGGVTQTEYFFIASDGLPYNDLAEGQGLPTYQKNPVGGLDQPRVTIMPSEQYLATVKASTLEAQARGEPTPTLPPPPASFSASQGAITATTTIVATTPAQSTVPILPTQAVTAVADTASTAKPTLPTPGEADFTDFFGSLMLAIIGVVSLGLFIYYRKLLYRWLGLENQNKTKAGNQNKKGKR